MTLTEEQRERMQKNKERALEIRRRKALERGSSCSSRAVEDITSSSGKREIANAHCTFGTGQKRQKLSQESHGAISEMGQDKCSEDTDDGEGGVVLEDFEVDASALITKKEAKEKYCLPEGTLVVCSFEEKDNPHRRGWIPMKLYRRSEIRQRARDRFGGLDGLVAERTRRMEKRYLKDLEITKDVFKNNRNRS